jgi:DtxR family Mn-dependent transcriptional regulator
VIRHHRLLEAYLVQALGYAWDEVHEEACRLEHVVSDTLEARMAAALGHPRRDPHGAFIPDSGLLMPVDNASPLVSLPVGETAIVRRVSDEDPELLRYLQVIGVIPERRVTVLFRSSLDGNLVLQVEGQVSSIVLGEVITRQIFVEESKIGAKP